MTGLMGSGSHQRRSGNGPESFQAESWTTRQLAEFLSVVSSFTDERDALQGCVERAAAAIGTEVAVLIREGKVAASVGFPPGSEPVADLVEASGDLRFERELGDLGVCTGICSLVGEEGTLLVARTGGRDFSKEELDLLRGMGRVLALALRSIRLIGELRERQTLLERLTLLQRSIASRADIEEVLDAIVTGASELLGDELVDLSLIDPEDPTVLEVVASVGYPAELLDQIRRTPIQVGIAGHAVTERRPIVVEDYGADPRRIPDVVGGGLRAVISAPVYQRGELVGALSLGTRRAGRRYSEIERERRPRLRGACRPRAERREGGRGGGAPGLPRSAHGPREPRPVRRPPRAGSDPRRRRGRCRGCPVRRSGRLQDGERQPRARSRRPAADHRRAEARLGGGTDRHGREVRRGRVRDPRRGRPPADRARADGAPRPRRTGAGDRGRGP